MSWTMPRQGRCQRSTRSDGFASVVFLLCGCFAREVDVLRRSSFRFAVAEEEVLGWSSFRVAVVMEVLGLEGDRWRVAVNAWFLLFALDI